MCSNTFQMNNDALAALNDGNFSLALHLFKTNAVRNPCHLTFNNLGLFYSEEGIETKNKTWRSAKILGLRYLLKASALETQFVNLFNIGVTLYKLSRFEDAYNYFGKAFFQTQNYICQYNMGVCCFARKRYDLAEDLYERLLNSLHNKDILELGGASPFVAVSFAKCLRNPGAFNDIMPIDEVLIDIHDKFVLSYLCGEFEKAISYCNQLLTEWQPSLEVVAMIYDCMARVSTPHNESYICKIIEDSYCSKASLIQNSPEVRMKYIENYNYIPPLIEKCGYYGCKIHGIEPNSPKKS